MNDDLIILHDARTPRADAQRNRDLLLNTARRLFEQHGVDSVPMSAVAEAAGVGKGTLYRHFPNKTELCATLIDEDQRGLQERTFTRMRQVRDPLANLRWFLGEAIAFVERNEAFLSSANEGLMPLMHPAHAWWLQTIRGLLGQALGANPHGINVQSAAMMLYIMIDPRSIHFQKQAQNWDGERILEGLWSVVERLVAA